jgi:hypothetical protein
MDEKTEFEPLVPLTPSVELPAPPAPMVIV